MGLVLDHLGSLFVERIDFTRGSARRLDRPEFDGLGSGSAFVIVTPHRVGVIVTALQYEFVDVLVQR